MVISHSYLSLPEGRYTQTIGNLWEHHGYSLGGLLQHMIAESQPHWFCFFVQRHDLIQERMDMIDITLSLGHMKDTKRYYDRWIYIYIYIRTTHCTYK